METPYICVQCGVQFAESDEPPSNCAICEDERQYVNPKGQTWTTFEELRASRSNVFTETEPGLTSIQTKPHFGIGQRAFLVESEHGNVLWDCLSLVDDATVREIEARGGLTAIAISHPHFYDSMVEWSRAFGDVPIYLHAADREWVMRPDKAVELWEGETKELNADMTLVRGGGHFPGSAVLLWKPGAEGRGVLLAADTVMALPDRKQVTFMFSFPNRIPLPLEEVRGVAAAVADLEFDRIYSLAPGLEIISDAKNIVARSAENYLGAKED